MKSVCTFRENLSPRGLEKVVVVVVVVVEKVKLSHYRLGEALRDP